MKSHVRILATTAIAAFHSLTYAQGSYLSGPNGEPAKALVVAPGGSIGIGTTEPRATLQINHAGRPDAFIFGKGTVDVPRMVMGHGADGRSSEVAFISSSVIGRANYVPMTFWTSDRERIRIGTTGNVGIGPYEDNIPDPTATLHVHGDRPTVLIQQNPGILGGPTLSLRGAGDAANKVRVILHAVTLESASGGGGDYLTIRNDSGAVAYFAHDGNVGIGTTAPQAKLDIAGKVRAQVLEITSDRAAKGALGDVHPREILRQVVSLPIATWTYNDSPGTRHIGPMAQDFHAHFGVGSDDQHIATVDADGVALAAIQGLAGLLEEKEVRIATLERQVLDLRERQSQQVSSQEKRQDADAITTHQDLLARVAHLEELLLNSEREGNLRQLGQNP